MACIVPVTPLTLYRAVRPRSGGGRPRCALRASPAACVPGARVLVPHPIQDRTDDEMRALADAALDDIVASLTATP